MHLLVVEDEPDLREMLEWALHEAGHEVTAVGDGRSAWQALGAHGFDLVLLDWMLPDIKGIDLLRRLRARPEHEALPVIMLTARDAVSDRITGLDAGADDYLVKPFSMQELLARIRARTRTDAEKPLGTISAGGVSVEPASHRVSVNGSALALGPTEYRLLLHFLQHRERVISRPAMLDAVWGPDVYIEERTVDVHIRRLRRALEPFGKHALIQTVRGAGYRFSTAEDEDGR